VIRPAAAWDPWASSNSLCDLNFNVFNVFDTKGSPVKNIVRALVLALAVIGFASEHALTAQAKVIGTAPVVSRIGMPPVPTCPPTDPSGCGMSGK
jgi:hypothetical protein